MLLRRGPSELQRHKSKRNVKALDLIITGVFVFMNTNKRFVYNIAV